MNQSCLSNPRINEVTQKVFHATKDALGDKLDKVILFGSYARGDFDAESDIDICILADVPREEEIQWRRDINRRILGIDLEYDILVSLRVINSNMFYTHINILPLYRNVLQDGVEING